MQDGNTILLVASKVVLSHINSPNQPSPENFNFAIVTHRVRDVKETGNSKLETSDVDYYGQDSKYGQVSIRSGYGGTFTLNGKTWKITYNDNLDGRLSSSDTIKLQPPQHESASLHFPKSIFLNDQAYTCKASFASDKQQHPRIVFSLTPQDLPLGQLKLTGQNLDYLQLKSKDITIPIFAPQPTINIPLGSYRCTKLRLKTADKHTTLSHDRFDTEFQITEDEPNTIKYGAPLIPSITATPKGQSVSLSFELKGQGGETYRLQSDENKPGFTEESIMGLIAFIVIASSVMLANIISAWLTRKRFHRGKYLLWLAIGSMLFIFIGMAIYIAVAIVVGKFDRSDLIQFLPQMLLQTVILGAILYIVQLPIVLLSLFNRYYQERFAALMGVTVSTKKTVPENPQEESISNNPNDN